MLDSVSIQGNYTVPLLSSVVSCRTVKLIIMSVLPCRKVKLIIMSVVSCRTLKLIIMSVVSCRTVKLIVMSVLSCRTVKLKTDHYVTVVLLTMYLLSCKTINICYFSKYCIDSLVLVCVDCDYYRLQICLKQKEICFITLLECFLYFFARWTFEKKSNGSEGKSKSRLTKDIHFILMFCFVITP